MNFARKVRLIKEYLQESFRERPGNWGWLILAIFITLWDIFAPETLSRAFFRALFEEDPETGTRTSASPSKRWPTIILWAYITAHLFKIIPDKYDLLCILAEKFARSYQEKQEIEKAIKEILDEDTSN